MSDASVGRRRAKYALEPSDIEPNARAAAVAGRPGRQLEKERAIGERVSRNGEEEDRTGGLLPDASALRQALIGSAMAKA